MKTIKEVQDKLRECINHAYRDKCEDIQKFGSNVKHLDEAMTLLNELVGILNSHKALEQVSALDKIRAKIMQLDYDLESVDYDYNDMAQTEMVHMICREEVLQILDKYKAESEVEE